jgi:hypothetical protein
MTCLLPFNKIPFTDFRPIEHAQLNSKKLCSRETKDVALYLGTYGGRPQAIVKLYTYDNELFYHQSQSLSQLAYFGAGAATGLAAAIPAGSVSCCGSDLLNLCLCFQCGNWRQFGLSGRLADAAEKQSQYH